MQKDEALPCDLVLWSANGQCFLETSGLNREKNLKPKGSHQFCLGLINDKICQLSGFLKYEMPNARLYSFDRDRLCKVQYASFNEKLGQISYVFSDKAVTLT